MDGINNFLFEQGKKAGQKSLPEIYRHSENYDEYIKTATEQGYNEDEAHEIYFELEHKYAN